MIFVLSMWVDLLIVWMFGGYGWLEFVIGDYLEKDIIRDRMNVFVYILLVVVY